MRDAKQSWNNVEPRIERHAGLDQILRPLIDGDDNGCDEQDVSSHPDYAIAFSTGTQRSHAVGNSVSLPTKGVMCQQRSHFAPSARSTFAANSPTLNSTEDTISNARRSSSCPRNTSYCSCGTLMVTAASKFAPMSLLFRASSSARFASSRTSIIVRHRALMLSTPTDAGTSSPPVGNDVRCTLAARSSVVGKNSQISSAVKLMSGANNRTSASQMRHSAVCALRRLGAPGANVYSRSFSTSRYMELRSTVQNSITR